MTEDRQALTLWEDRAPATREVRDPSAATQQLTYMGRDAPMVAEWDAGHAIRFGYYANVIAYRCIQIKARAIAALPVRCGPDTMDRTNISMGAPLARLLGPPPGGPAPKLSGRKLIAWSLAQKYATGRFAWELELGDDGTPIYFWPLVSDSLKAVPTDSGSEWFRAFEYGRASQPTRLTPDRVFYDWTPSQYDFRQPESALQAARYDLTAAVMGDRYSVAFLKNGAVPAAMVITQRPPDQPAQDRFEQRWAADYQGPDNANRVGFQYVDPGDDGDVSKLIDVKVLGLTQKDSQFIAAHKEHLSQIAIALGVPWSKLDASGRTFDNAGHEDDTFWESLSFDMADLEDAINLELAPRVGSDLMWFDTSGVECLNERNEPASQKVGADVLYRAGVWTLNEARGDYGLPPVPGGDTLLSAADVAVLSGGMSTPAETARTVSPAVRSGEAPAQVPPPAPVAPALTAEEERQAEEDRAAAVELRRAQIWKSADAQVRVQEKRWQRAFARLFERQGRSAVTALTGKRGHKLMLEQRAPDPEPDLEAIFNLDYWIAQTEAVAEDLYEGTAAVGAARVADAFAVDFDLDAPYAQDFIHSRANQLAGQVTDTTYRALQDIMGEGIAAGDDVETIARAISAEFDQFALTRSVTIARTEVVSAFNGSATLAASQLPEDTVGGQEWISTRDSRTRESHVEADGQIQPIGSPFDVGGGMMYPGDPAGGPDQTVNCRCTVAFLTPAEYEAAGGGRSRTVEHRTARALLATVDAASFDELRFRRALREVAA